MVQGLSRRQVLQGHRARLQLYHRVHRRLHDLPDCLLHHGGEPQHPVRDGAQLRGPRLRDRHVLLCCHADHGLVGQPPLRALAGDGHERLLRLHDRRLQGHPHARQKGDVRRADRGRRLHGDVRARRASVHHEDLPALADVGDDGGHRPLPCPDRSARGQRDRPRPRPPRHLRGRLQHQHRLLGAHLAGDLHVLPDGCAGHAARQGRRHDRHPRLHLPLLDTRGGRGEAVCIPASVLPRQHHLHVGHQLVPPARLVLDRPKRVSFAARLRRRAGGRVRGPRLGLQRRD
mmetsp:Transcript_45076/g.145039  ORF Transcript_45076/g.145039 Transcript_45076/m.145039 type:complete len:288 (-) Transcript_45076:1539-2402(-)